MLLYELASVTTNNFTDPEVFKKIGMVWEKAHNILEERKDIEYGVYHNYNSDYKGDYTLSIATSAFPTDDIIKVDSYAKYRVFNVDTAKVEGISNTWKYIWELEEKEEILRAYTIDFEKYYPDGTVEIHIALKEEA